MSRPDDIRQRNEDAKERFLNQAERDVEQGTVHSVVCARIHPSAFEDIAFLLSELERKDKALAFISREPMPDGYGYLRILANKALADPVEEEK